MSRALCFVVSDPIGEYLDDMLRSGLWGESEDDMLSSLVMIGVQHAIRDTLIALRVDPGAEEVVTEHVFKCKVCQDGYVMDGPKDAAGHCSACGCDFIPF